jgi:hypothetical protein
MLAGVITMVSGIPTFDSPKVAKARLPIPFGLQVKVVAMNFFVPGGDILDDRLVTFLTIVGNLFVEWW